jgi:16S rRNA (guanine966-N2)-methyltransferase
MRITGGYYKGRKIYCPKGIIRPAMDRMRESLFAILGDLSDRSFLDLFSGSGVVGVEAASRGAEPVVLVEKDRLKITALKRNISFIHTEIRIALMPVERFLKRSVNRYDYIYVDPPFNMQGKNGILQTIASCGIFSGRGNIIIHVPREEALQETIECLHITDTRHYGGSVLLFYDYLDGQRPPGVSGP